MISDRSTPYNQHDTPPVTSNLIDAREKFLKSGSDNEETLNRPKEIMTVDATDFDMNMNINIPIRVEKGHKAKIMIVTEKTGTNSTTNTGKIGSMFFSDIEEQPSRQLAETIHHSVAESLLTQKYVEQQTNTELQKDDTIISEDGGKEGVSVMENNSAFKVMIFFSNVAISISAILAVIFLSMFALDLFISKMDALFAFIMTSMGALLFGLDKGYRRRVNEQ
jgi:hypothetical protein